MPTFASEALGLKLCLPYFLRQHLSLDLELADSARLVGQKAPRWPMFVFQASELHNAQVDLAGSQLFMTVQQAFFAAFWHFSRHPRPAAL